MQGLEFYDTKKKEFQLQTERKPEAGLEKMSGFKTELRTEEKKDLLNPGIATQQRREENCDVNLVSEIMPGLKTVQNPEEKKVIFKPGIATEQRTEDNSGMKTGLQIIPGFKTEQKTEEKKSILKPGIATEQRTEEKKNLWKPEIATEQRTEEKKNLWKPEIATEQKAEDNSGKKTGSQMMAVLELGLHLQEEDAGEATEQRIERNSGTKTESELGLHLHEDESELMPGLPNHITLEILLRVSAKAIPCLRRVSGAWRTTACNPHFFNTRKKQGFTRPHVCTILASSHYLALYEPASDTWQTLPPPADFVDTGLPMLCQIVSAGHHLLLMGGWHPFTFAVLTSVYVYNFLSGTWRRGADMPAPRSMFSAAADASGHRVLIAGGHDPNKNALRTAHIYDVAADEWLPLPLMRRERDECKAVATRGSSGEVEFVVISGYETETQGVYATSAEVLSAEGDTWREVEDFWPGGRVPPSSVACAAGGDALYAVLDGQLSRRDGDTWRAVSGCAFPESGKSASSCVAADLGGGNVFVSGYCSEPTAFVYSNAGRVNGDVKANGGVKVDGGVIFDGSNCRKVKLPLDGCGLVLAACSVEL